MKSPDSSQTPDSCLPPAIPGKRTALLICGSAAVLVLALHTLLTSSAFAQPAPPANAKTPAAKTQTPQQGKPVATTPNKAASTSASSSRYVDETDLAAYVASRSAVFSMRERATDPFGQLQDPDAKPIPKAPSASKSSHRVAAVQATPFSDIVRLIKVTTIMPKGKCFMVGIRRIKEGDSILLKLRGKNIRVAITSVSSRQIEFRNLENGETASLKLDMLPGGMTPGGAENIAPGMVPDHPNSPLELDPGITLTDKSQNR